MSSRWSNSCPSRRGGHTTNRTPRRSSPLRGEQAAAAGGGIASILQDGVVYFKATKVHHMKVGQLSVSPFKTIRDAKYHIQVGKMQSDQEGEYTLGFWVNCAPVRREDVGPDWSCFADLQFQMLPTHPDRNPIAWSDTVVFHDKNRECGWYDFYPWEDLFPDYINRGSIELEVLVRNQVLFRNIKDPTLPPAEHLLPQRRYLDDFASPLFNSNRFSDITFVIGGRSIPAHRFVLAAKSRAFENMVFITHKDDDEIIFEADEVDPDAFLAILRFFYKLELVVTPSIIPSLHHLASKWNLDVILKATLCHICPENFFILLEYSKKDTRAGNDDGKHLKSMEDECFAFLRQNANKLLTSPDFINATREQIKMAVVSDHFIANEYKIFYHCMDWAMRCCTRQGIPKIGVNLRKVLGPVFSLIRFPLMTETEFTDVKQAQVLTDDEVEALDLYFNSGKKVKRNLKFDTRPRKS